MSNLPREILNMIINLVKPDPFQAKAMANSMYFIENNASSRLWRSIFKDEAWFKAATDLGAEPVLIGANLDDVVANRPGKKKSAYIILYPNDFSGDLFHDGIDLLCESLRTDHRYNKERHEVILPAKGWREPTGEKIKLPKIILNVRDIIKGDAFLYLEGKTTRRLNGNGLLQTKFCFLSDSRIQSLDSCDIIGIGGAISKKDSLTPVCTMNLRGKTKKWQVSILEPKHEFRRGRQNLVPLYEGGKSYVPHKIIAWEYRWIE